MPANTPRGYTYPLFTDPMQPAPQIQDLAQDIDADLTAFEARHAAALDRPSARLTGFANQNVPTNTPTNMLLSASDYDNDFMYLPPNTLRLTDTGVYWVTGRVTLEAFGAGAAFGITAALLSSAGFIPTMTRTSQRGLGTRPTWISISTLHYHTGIGNDDITLNVTQHSGNTLIATFRNICATKISALVGGS